MSAIKGLFIIKLIQHIKSGDITYNNACNKECNSNTKNLPCMSINKNDNTCFDYMEHGGCPAGTVQCIHVNNNPCNYCDNDYPCLHDNYGDYSCLPLNGIGECSPGSTLCILRKPSWDNICSKNCSKDTLGLPCMHNNNEYDICYDLMDHGGCPTGTTHCIPVDNPCKYCDNEYPCLHDNNGHYSCFATNINGECISDNILCPQYNNLYMNSNYYAKSNDIITDHPYSLRNLKYLITITAINATIVYIIAALCVISIACVLYVCCFIQKRSNKKGFKEINSNDNKA